MESVGGALRTGTVTFFFCDLVGSSRLWEEHPDVMREALACHDAIIRDAVEAHGGHVVKATGDGAHAVFASARGAASAAVAAQRAPILVRPSSLWIWANIVFATVAL